MAVVLEDCVYIMTAESQRLLADGYKAVAKAFKKEDALAEAKRHHKEGEYATVSKQYNYLLGAWEYVVFTKEGRREAWAERNRKITAEYVKKKREKKEMENINA